MKNKNDTILIEIAAYIDPEVVNTVKSALIQADYPDRVHFAICYQSDNLDDYNELKKIKNCKIKYFKESEARGSVYARYFCQQLLEDEKYIYQIDSHMRFVKHWDTKIIEQLESLNDPKAILTVYPPFCTEDMMKKPLDDEIYDNPADGGVMYTNGFRDSSTYFLSCNSIPIKKDDYRAYKRNAFIAAGNFFTYAQAHRDVLHDKSMYFYGDELPMSIRLFTHGWNAYIPGESYIYHQYERKNQKFPPVTDAMKIENKRLMALLSIEGKPEDLEEFGLGTERTLQEYEEFAGINFKNQKVYMCAETGEYENPDMKNKISYLQNSQTKKHNYMNESEEIDIVMIDLFNEYKDCIESCLKTSTKVNKINFIIATTDKKEPSKEYIKNNHIKEIIYLDEGAEYVPTLAKATEYLGDNYVAIIDSSYRFIKDWDKCLCQSIKLCGDKSALTSWVWRTNPDTDLNTLCTYNNVIKEFNTFYNYIANLKYNETIELSKRGIPYPTHFISDGFIFCKSEIFKQIPVDPNLTYEEHQYIYSVRLWTHGVNIFYPTVSYMVRTKDEQLFHNGIKNLNIVCALTGLNNYYSKTTEANYKYDIGTARPIWMWYDSLNIKYDATNMQLIEEKK